MSDTTGLVDAGRRAYVRRHGHPTTREFRPDEVAGDAIEPGRAVFAASRGNASAATALASGGDDLDDPAE